MTKMRLPLALAVIIGMVTLVGETRSQDDIVRTVTHMDASDHEPREHPIDISHMHVSVSFEPEKALVKGRVTHKFKVLRESVDSIVFDGIKMDIKQATLNGRPVRFDNNGTTITIHCEEPLKWDSLGTSQLHLHGNAAEGYLLHRVERPNEQDAQADLDAGSGHRQPPLDPDV